MGIRDELGQPVAVGDIGDLYIKGPSAALLYWNSRDKSTATFQGEWVKSGDKYTVDADGYYSYAGRSDDMLKVSGQYVSPIEVESALMAHEQVLECAVVGQTDVDGLTKTIALVVPHLSHIPIRRRRRRYALRLLVWVSACKRRKNERE